MKLNLVTETYPPEVNGVAMTLSRLVKGMARRGHELLVIRPQQGKADGPRREGSIEEWTVPGLPLPGYAGLHFGLPATGKLLKRWREERPHLVHIATEGPLGWSALRAARKLGIEVSSSFHTNFHSYGKHYGYGVLKRIALNYLRWIHNRTRVTFVPSEDILTTLEEDGFRKCHVLGRGVDTVLFDPAKRDENLRREWGVPEGGKVAIHVGRVAGEKNIPLAIKAFVAMREIDPTMKFVLVGDGPLRAGLEKQHPEFIFAGMRRGEDLARYYASGDVFLFPSVTETFGNVLTEALASGLVTLSFDYAAAQKHVDEGVNGHKVTYEDEAAFIEAARRLAHTPESWSTLREAARQTALGISWDAIVEMFESRLETLSTGQEPS